MGLGLGLRLFIFLANQKHTKPSAEPGGGWTDTEVHRTLSWSSRAYVRVREKHTNSYCCSEDFPAERSRKIRGLLLPAQLLAGCVTWGRGVYVSVPQMSSGF